MRSSTDRMHLVAMVNPPTSQYAENWRHPLSRQDWLSAEFYVDLARTLERGCFDMLFLPDALAVPEDHAGNYGTRLQVGSATVKRALKKAADDRAAASASSSFCVAHGSARVALTSQIEPLFTN